MKTPQSKNKKIFEKKLEWYDEDADKYIALWVTIHKSNGAYRTVLSCNRRSAMNPKIVSELSLVAAHMNLRQSIVKVFEDALASPQIFPADFTSILVRETHAFADTRSSR